MFKFLKNQAINVIDWQSSDAGIMAYQFPVKGNEIKMGAQLTVREGQTAIFINEGRLTDIFEPGRYTLSTKNLPILTKLLSLPMGFKSPFKSEVYFINTTLMRDLKWGTSNPIMMRDQDFGMIRMRARGAFAFKVGDPAVFLRELLGTLKVFRTSEIADYIKAKLISGIADYIATSKIAALDLAMSYNEIGEGAVEQVGPKFEPLGLELISVIVENISLPEEVEKAMDERTSIGVAGDLNKYTQFQAAKSLRDAANNPNGNSMMGAGIGLGAGGFMGQQMAQSLNNSQQAAQAPQTPMISCANCGAKVKEGAKFCPECGKKPQLVKVPCVKCGSPIKEGAKFCPECGSSQEKPKCVKCGVELRPGAKFCPECGSKQE